MQAPDLIGPGEAKHDPTGGATDYATGGTTSAATGDTTSAATGDTTSAATGDTTSHAAGDATSKCSQGQLAGIWVGLLAAIFLSALDQTILNVVIPKIATVLNAIDRSAWIITSYLLFSTIATPIAGKLADIYGVKNVLSAATLLFAAASILCGMAGMTGQIFGCDAISQLILARALQGTAGGAMLGLCFISIGEIFPLHERGKYQGYLAAAYIVAALIGPALGGYIADKIDWRWVFYLNIPPAALAALAFFVSFPQSMRAKAKPIIDSAGIALFVGFLVPLILGAAQLGKLGSADALCTSEFVIALICLATFLWRETQAPEPLIPLTVFKNKLIAISLATVFVTGIGLFGSMLLMAFILQQIIGQSATAAGITLIPLMLTTAGASVAGGLLLSKTGKYKLLCLAALSLLCLGTYLISTIGGVGNGTSAARQLLVSYGSIGAIGLGLLLPVHTIIIQKVAPGEIMGVSTALTQFFRSLGGTLGTGLMSALLLCLMRHGPLAQAISQVLEIYAGLLVMTIFLNFFLPEVPLRINAQPGQKDCAALPPQP